MRYFCYIDENYDDNSKKHIIVIVDENSDKVKFYPIPRYVGRFAKDKRSWLYYYQDFDRRKLFYNEPVKMFEICENQFKKYEEKGIIPENWDF